MFKEAHTGHSHTTKKYFVWDLGEYSKADIYLYKVCMFTKWSFKYIICFPFAYFFFLCSSSVTEKCNCFNHLTPDLVKACSTIEEVSLAASLCVDKGVLLAEVYHHFSHCQQKEKSGLLENQQTKTN